MDRARGFAASDRRILLEVIHDAMQDIIPRYRALHEQGQIELSTTPYGHPIVPLLLDFDSMADAQPEAPRPEHAGYPGGLERARSEEPACRERVWRSMGGGRAERECRGVGPLG